VDCAMVSVGGLEVVEEAGIMEVVAVVPLML
jgi:hypothetical protein